MQSPIIGNNKLKMINEILQWIVVICILYALAKLSGAQATTSKTLKIIKYVLWKNEDKT